MVTKFRGEGYLTNFVNSIILLFLRIAKARIIYWIFVSYLTGVVAAEQPRLLSNMKVIQIVWQLHSQVKLLLIWSHGEAKITSLIYITCYPHRYLLPQVNDNETIASGAHLVTWFNFNPSMDK